MSSLKELILMVQVPLDLTFCIIVVNILKIIAKRCENNNFAFIMCDIL